MSNKGTKSKREKKGKFQKTIFMAIMLVYFGICGAAGAMLFDNMQRGLGRGSDEFQLKSFLVIYVVIIVTMLISIYLHMYLHELGHMIFGMLTGYKFQSIRFGSLMILKSGDGLKMKKYSLAGTGGQCLMTPPDVEGDDYPTGWYNWGGCIVNTILVVIFGVLYLVTDTLPVLQFFSAVMVLIGFFFVLTNGLIPMSAIGNDGYNAIHLQKDRKARHGFKIQLLMLNEQITNQSRLKDMPAEWFDWKMEPTEDSLVAAQGVFRVSYLIDSARFEEARELIDYLLENVTALAQVHEAVLHGEKIFLDCVLGKAKEEIKQDFENQEKNLMTLKLQPTMQRILYTYYKLVAEDEEKAGKALAQFEKLAVKYPYPSDIESDRELLAVVDSKVTSSVES